MMTLAQIAGELNNIEGHVFHAIETALNGGVQPRERSTCDKIFGMFTHQILLPYAENALTHRAGDFSRQALIPLVLNVEANLKIQFHKGALFYDTALAFFCLATKTLVSGFSR